MSAAAATREKKTLVASSVGEPERGGAARSERRGGRCEEGRQSHCRPSQHTLETIEAAHNHLTNQSEHVLG